MEPQTSLWIFAPCSQTEQDTGDFLLIGRKIFTAQRDLFQIHGLFSSQDFRRRFFGQVIQSFFIDDSRHSFCIVDFCFTMIAFGNGASQVLDHGGHFVPYGIADGPHRPFQRYIRCNHIPRLAPLDHADCQDSRIRRFDFTGNDGLQSGNHSGRGNNRISTLVRMSSMPRFPNDSQIDIIGRCHKSTCPETHTASIHRWPGVHGKNGLGIRVL